MEDDKARQLVLEIREDMVLAMKSRDILATSTLRTLLARISNAEAVNAADNANISSTPVAGASQGVGSTEMPRKELTYAGVHDILNAEVNEIEETLKQLGAEASYGDELRQRKAIVQKYLK